MKSWKKIKTEEKINCGKWYKIEKDLVEQPGGDEGTYYVIRKNSSVVIIPIDQDGNIHMTLQHRYPVNKFSLEFPAGQVDEGDKKLALQSAMRELEEEVQLASTDWKLLGTVDEAIGMAEISVFVFLAKNVQPKKNAKLDPLDKNLHETRIITQKELFRVVASNEITDSITLAGFGMACAKGIFSKK